MTLSENLYTNRKVLVIGCVNCVSPNGSCLLLINLNVNDFLYYLISAMLENVPAKAIMGTSNNILSKLENLNLHFQIQSIPRSQLEENMLYGLSLSANGKQGVLEFCRLQEDVTYQSQC